MRGLPLRRLLLLICRGLAERRAGQTETANGENRGGENLVPGHKTSYPISHRARAMGKVVVSLRNERNSPLLDVTRGRKCPSHFLHDPRDATPRPRHARGGQYGLAKDAPDNYAAGVPQHENAFPPAPSSPRASVRCVSPVAPLATTPRPIFAGTTRLTGNSDTAARPRLVVECDGRQTFRR